VRRTWLICFAFLFAILSFSQLKVPLTHVVAGGFTVSSIEILTNPEKFYGQSIINVGVRINFIRTVGQAAAYSFDLKENEIKLMSIRLIGLKLSETETNTLIYYGPTSAFPSNYQYGGFQIVGFYVTKADLDAGYKEIWGWRVSYPLACRNFSIIADLDMDPVYNQPMAGVHKGAQVDWVSVQRVTAPMQSCEFVRKDQVSQQQTQQYFQVERILDILVEPEPFELGQQLKITVLADSKPQTNPWDQYLVYWINVKYQNGQTSTIPHSFGNFNPNSAIIVTSTPKGAGDVRYFVVNQAGSVSYVLPETIKIPFNSSIVEVEIKVQLWAGLDVDRFSPYDFTKRWVAKIVFVPKP